MINQWVEGYVEEDLKKTEIYRNLAYDLQIYIAAIRSENIPETIRKLAVDRLREKLIRCLFDENLSDLTSIYRNAKMKNALGYDPKFVNLFVQKLQEACNDPFHCWKQRDPYYQHSS